MSVPPRDLKNPTVSRSKIVASRSERSRFIRQSLAAVVRFIRRRPSSPEVEGELSGWIAFLHGFLDKKSEEGHLTPRIDEALVQASSNFVNRWLGPGIDVRQADRSLAQAQKVTAGGVPKIVDAARRGNVEGARSLISETTSDVMEAVGLPPNLFGTPGLSYGQFAKFRRAVRATLICLTLQNEHPLVLITRAEKGDRAAILSLVKADKLFAHDSCCAVTIKKAELQDDQGFIGQLTRALEYQPTVRRRDILQVYYKILFLLAESGVSLPTLYELCSALDPHGMEYESLSAFEKDFQRRRRDFIAMVRKVDEEVPVRWKGSSVPK
ncbi:MAG TPA: hypothetical protein VNY29_15595 [Terriglobales bacterium]|nr:hypothetical protein [Terriglobales bacterium]